MKITNKHNLPKAIVEAVENDYHQHGDYSTTQLPKCAKEVQLTKRHYDEIEVDVVDKIWVLFGKSIHSILEGGKNKDALVEEYLEADFSGIKLTGTSDHLEGNTISDWKCTSAWTTVYKSTYGDWEKQLNVYAYLYKQYGFKIEKVQDVLILRDFSKSKALAGGNYPQIPVQIVPQKLWTEVEQIKYIEERLAYHQKFIDMADDEIPECLPVNRWKKDDSWALMKEGRKSAVKVEATEDAIRKYMKNNVKKDLDKHEIVLRKGQDTKCKDYCEVASFCNYWKKTYSLE